MPSYYQEEHQHYSRLVFNVIVEVPVADDIGRVFKIRVQEIWWHRPSNSACERVCSHFLLNDNFPIPHKRSLLNHPPVVMGSSKC